MSYNGSGVFQINTSGQPVVAGTVITASAFNALTADLATGLTTAITKDGQTTTTARITFAQGITSSLATDSSSTSTGSIITAGGAGIAKNLYVGVNANVAGTLGVTGVATFSAAPIYSSLTASSAVATDASKGLVSVTNTGTGSNVLAISPTLVTPILGTPQSGTLTNCTGLPTTALTGAITEANGGTGTTIGYNGFKNRIINGGMGISQRNGTTSVNVPGTSYPYQMDRFYCGGLNGVATPFTLQQVSDAPTGFANSTKITVANVDTLSNAATEYGFQQTIEANNTIDFNLGTANAVSVTLSFWVKSSLIGTFGVGIRNAPTFNRSYVGTYVINVANTWEQKTITLTMDTTGTWTSSGSNASMNVAWSLGVGTNLRGTANIWQAGGAVQTSGSVNLVSNAAATWQVTGVQLEKGSTATSFDYRPYGTELALCQRYFYQATEKPYAIYNGPSFGQCGPATMPVTMRAAPTLAAGATFQVGGGSAGTVGIYNAAGSVPSPDAVTLYNTASNWTTNGNVSYTAGFSAEL